MYEDEMAFMSCEDRNYYRDARVTAKRAEVPKGPFEWIVCNLCQGKGKVVNPSIDASGLTAEDFHEDPDLAEDYRSGVYDIPCARCGGRTTIPSPDADQEREAQERKERWGDIDPDRLNMRWKKSACPCGSGDEAYEVLDSRGIYLSLGCETCLPASLESYRADVLYGPTYEVDEPIEPEEY